MIGLDFKWGITDRGKASEVKFIIMDSKRSCYPPLADSYSPRSILSTPIPPIIVLPIHLYTGCSFLFILLLVCIPFSPSLSSPSAVSSSPPIYILYIYKYIYTYLFIIYFNSLNYIFYPS
ncbi:hypothetical protein BDB01DRAFT_140322 [Pilobolus umbonatus]|nr:hypothetical protein BDB01DRAFT_140322 [Pilobolus umbonatus]